MKEQLEEVVKKSNFVWEQPAPYDLSVLRKDYRNIYGYSENWVQKHDLFGLNRFLPLEYRVENT